MAKTNFIDGITAVSAAWLNQHFGVGGHVHDGQDEDGHAPKIDANGEIAWGSTGFGRLEGTLDDGAQHQIEHLIDGGGAHFEGGTIHARSKLSPGYSIEAETDVIAAGALIAPVAQINAIEIKSLAQLAALTLSGETYVILSALGASPNPLRLQVEGT